MNIRHSAALHLRGMKELRKVSPSFFPVLTLQSIFVAVSPYVTVFFSAQVLKELATLRRPEIIWQWVIGCVLCVGITAIAKALLQRRYNTLRTDLYERKELLFVRKMFAMDYADLDNQATHDLLAQIQQSENWSNWGLMRVDVAYRSLLVSIIGILSAITLTVSLFTSPVPTSAGWLTGLNNPLYILILAVLKAVVTILAGKLGALSN